MLVYQLENPRRIQPPISKRQRVHQIAETGLGGGASPAGGFSPLSYLRYGGTNHRGYYYYLISYLIGYTVILDNSDRSTKSDVHEQLLIDH